jgi:acetyl esterase/lipase
MVTADLPMVATRRWRPRGAVAWLLTVIAIVFAAVSTLSAFYMIKPVDWNGLGRSGLLAFYFPFHILAASLVFGALAWLAQRLGARLAAVLLGAVVVVTVMMSLVPTVAMWRFARREGVSLSLSEYLHNSGLSLGGPDRARTVEYATAPDGTKLLLDVWLPQTTGAGLRPVVVRIHGGCWTHGTRGMIDNWNRWLNERGYAVFDVGYRLPPPEGWKNEIGDVKCALGWVGANASKYGVDPDRISTMGFSSGGHLALLASYTAGDPQLPASCDVPSVRIKSVINLYGPADLPLSYRSGGTLGYVRDCLTEYIGGTPKEFPDRYRLVSPISHIGPATPPTITFHGVSDRLIASNQAERLQEALLRAGVPQETYLLPANDHAFDLVWGSFGSQFARRKVEAFLQQHP